MKEEIFKMYVERILKRFSLTREELFSKDKRLDIVGARQILWYLCAKRPMRISAIQRFMEAEGHSVSHTTIIHGVKVVTKNMAEDKDYVTVIKQLNQ